MTRIVAARRLNLLSYLHFLITHGRKKKAEVFQSTLADKYSVSLRTIIRDLCWLRDAGYLTWIHIAAAHGGDKCRFIVTPAGAQALLQPRLPFKCVIADVIAVDSENVSKEASHADLPPPPQDGSVLQSSFTREYNPNGSSSIAFELQQEWERHGEALCSVAQYSGLSSIQVKWLRLAAKKFGTVNVWYALIRALQRGYAREQLDRIVYGMVRRSGPVLSHAFTEVA